METNKSKYTKKEIEILLAMHMLNLDGLESENVHSAEELEKYPWMGPTEQTVFTREEFNAWAVDKAYETNSGSFKQVESETDETVQWVCVITRRGKVVYDWPLSDGIYPTWRTPDDMLHLLGSYGC